MFARCAGFFAPIVLMACLGLSAQEPPKSSPPAKKSRDLAKLSVHQRNVYLGAQRATEWLHKANKPDGRFVCGFVPALRVPLEGDDLKQQAGAGYALAKAARFFDDDRAAAIAKQAALTLLLDTTTDPKEKHLRYTAAPTHLLNRTAATALLVLAVNELPSPAKDLVEQTDQMTDYLRTRLAADGAVQLSEPAPGTDDDKDHDVQHYSGYVLYAVARTHEYRPAAWKLEALRKACPYYHRYWTHNKNVAMVPWHSAAYAEAYRHTREKAFADCVYAMNDWLCDLQYTKAEALRGHWLGGFMTWRKDKAVSLPPDARGAEAAFSLAQACRVARLAGDLPRLARYQKALEASLQFLGTLQYTDANAQHFVEWFRPAIVGGFHASHHDGNLRIEYTQNALLAQLEYLAHQVEW